MLVRSVLVAASVLAATAPGLAETLSPDAARKFVAGKLFAFNCFDGSSGQGRIFNDGSVAGLVRMRSSGATRFMQLPAGTLFPKGDQICSQVKGAFFNPCFNLTKTSATGFRGAVSGFGFAYCDFQRGGGKRDMVASVAPPSTNEATTAALAPRASIRRGKKADKPAHEQPVAAPSTPVTATPLPAVEQAGIRPSINP